MFMRIGGQAPVVLDRHLDAEVAAEVRHLLVRLDRRAAASGRCRGCAGSRRRVRAEWRSAGCPGRAPAASSCASTSRRAPRSPRASAWRSPRRPCAASSSGPARLVGALLEMCWHLTPVAAILVASLSSHLRPEGLIGSNGPAGEHAVVGDVAEQPREDVHVGHAGERVLRELREVQHGDLAVLLLHLLGRPAARSAAIAARSARRFAAASALPAPPAALRRPECPPAPRRRCGSGRRRAARPPATAAAAGERALLEDRSNRPGARRDARQAILVRLELRERLFGRRQRHPRDREPGARDPEKIPSVHVHAVLVLIHQVVLARE